MCGFYPDLIMDRTLILCKNSEDDYILDCPYIPEIIPDATIN